MLPLGEMWAEMVYFPYYNGDDPPLPEFEYDEAKSRMNLEKHGIDFDRARGLWLDPQRIEIEARAEGEPRFMTVGLLDGKHWSAFITYRGDAVRIISVRRARLDEVALYEDRR